MKCLYIYYFMLNFILSFMLLYHSNDMSFIELLFLYVVVICELVTVIKGP